jgi:hypothetical protein
MTARLRRASGRHGDLVRLIDVLDCIQTRERKAAGDGMAAVRFGFKRASSIWSKIEQNKIIRRST